MVSNSQKLQDIIVRYKLIKRSFYLVCLASLVILLSLQTYSCFVKFLERPTYVSSKIVSQNQASFPALTICPQEGYKESVLQTHGIEGIRKYNYKYELKWTSNDSNISETELFEQATFGIEELIKRVFVRFLDADDDDDIATVLKLDKYSLQEQRHRPFGRCYTLHLDKSMFERGIYYYKIDLHQSSKIYFHHVGQYLDMNGRMGYEVNVGDVAQSQVSWTDIRMMSKENADGSRSCIESVYDHCMYGALVRYMKERTKNEGGCTVPWVMDDNEGTTKICKDPENINATFWTHWNHVTNQKDDCPVPCHTLQIILGAKNYFQNTNNSHARIILYFAPRTMVSQELLLYTPLSLFAEIGGYVGLLLGVSILNFAAWMSDLLERNVSRMTKIF